MGDDRQKQRCFCGSQRFLTVPIGGLRFLLQGGITPSANLASDSSHPAHPISHPLSTKALVPQGDQGLRPSFGYQRVTDG